MRDKTAQIRRVRSFARAVETASADAGDAGKRVERSHQRQEPGHRSRAEAREARALVERGEEPT